MRTNLWTAALVAALLPAAAAASPGAPGSLLQNSLSLAMPLVSVAPAVLAGDAAAPPTLALATPFVGGVGYRPRGYRGGSTTVMPTTTQIHVGFFDPTDNFSTGFDGGFRVGPQVDPHVQLGVGVDWWHKAESATTDLGSVPLPGGAGSKRLVLSRTSADLVPMMAFVQVSGDENMRVIPYGGFGVGYEWLLLSADDALNPNNSFDQTFGGFGWQLWGGAGLPLDGRTRVNGEVFYNGCEVGSDEIVDIPGFGTATVRDVVKVNGVGMRVGVSWGF